MQIKFEIILDTDKDNLTGFLEVLKGFTPGAVQTGEVKPDKPEKLKTVKPEKDKTVVPDTKTTGTPDTKKEEVKPDEKQTGIPDSKPLFDLSTDDKIEEAKVKLREKTAALNAAGYSEFTRKAVNKSGNASSITKMEAKFIPDYWDMLILIENGQTDKI